MTLTIGIFLVVALFFLALMAGAYAASRDWINLQWLARHRRSLLYVIAAFWGGQGVLILLRSGKAPLDWIQIVLSFVIVAVTLAQLWRGAPANATTD